MQKGIMMAKTSLKAKNFKFVNTAVYYGDMMETVPTRLTKRLILELDKLIEEGWYSNRSEAVRDAVRELVEKKRIEMLEAAVREDIKWGLYGA